MSIWCWRAVDGPGWEAASASEALRSLGFRELGFVRLVPPMTVAQMAADYAEPDRSAFVAHGDDPMRMWVSADGTATAGVDWWYDDRPTVRFRTIVGDGVLVETLKRWRREPALAPGRRRVGDADVRQARAHAPGAGRSVRVIDTDDVAVQFGAHLEHVEAVGGAPREVGTMSDVLAVERAAFTHALACERQRGSVTGGLSSGLFLAAILAFVLGTDAWGFLGGVAAGAGVLFLVSPAVLAVARSIGTASLPEFHVDAGPAGVRELVWDPASEPPPRPSRLAQLGPAAALAVVVFGKAKWLLAAAKLLKMGTLASMLVSVWAYAWLWGWPFAVGFVALLFVHELGHALVMRHLGLAAGAPVFVPFVGAVIAMRDRPRDAHAEALVGIGGPALGGAAALGVLVVGWLGGGPFWYALAATGLLLNLFNLLPVSPLDGGRIAGGIHRGLWIVGYAIGVPWVLLTGSPVLALMLMLGVLQLWSLWRSPVPGYYDIPPWRRAGMGLAYFGLCGVLLWGQALALSALP